MYRNCPPDPMSKESLSESCNCKKLTERLVASGKENERLAKIIHDLEEENVKLQTELQNKFSSCTGSRPGATGDEAGYRGKYEALVEINHGWQKDYEELHGRFEMLNGEKRLLEDEEKKLKAYIDKLEKRQRSLESEVGRLAAALYAQRDSNDRQSPSEEQCEILKSQMVVYKEDFEREREDREKLNEEKEEYKMKLQDSEEIIRKLTAELDACKARERHRAENGYLNERSPRHQVQFVYPYQPVDQRWRLEQQRRGILPRHPPPNSLFYGGEVEVDECYSKA